MRARVGQVRGWRVRLAGRESERRARQGKAAQASKQTRQQSAVDWLAGWLAGWREGKER